MYEDIDSRMFFDDRSNSSLESILVSIRTLVMKQGISGAVIDYLQILTANKRMSNTSEEQQLGISARLLKNIAKELGIFIILLSQIRRDPQNPCPNLTMIRGSGQIAEAADFVGLVYRPQYYNEEFGLTLSYPSPYENVDTNNTAMILIQKGRNVGTGKFICGFNPNTTDFYPLYALPYKTGENYPPISNDPLSPF
jgi:replicative DNA helicase